MRITITQDHIERGEYSRTAETERESTCPVALAILEQVPGVVSVFVTYSNVSVTVKHKKRTKAHIFKLPQSVTKFIAALDEGRPIGPRSFNIPLEA